MPEGWRVVENPDGSFMVQRSGGHRAHRVISTGGLECCDCEDFHFRGHTCVHIRVLRAWQDWLLERSPQQKGRGVPDMVPPMFLSSCPSPCGAGNGSGVAAVATRAHEKQSGAEVSPASPLKRC